MMIPKHILDEINKDPIDDFEGFSSNQMAGLLYDTYNENKSPLILNKEIFDKNLINNKLINDLIKYLDHLSSQQPLKLTQKGHLPRKFCRELCDMDVLEDDLTAFKNRPINREEDSYYLSFIDIFTRLIGFSKKKHGKLLLTKKCDTFLENKSLSELYRYLFVNYTRKFNWGYNDLYPEAWIIQGGFPFSLFLVQKYGAEKRNVKFYADKFLQAFPLVMRTVPDSDSFTNEENFQRCYSLRTFDRFLKRFGLIDIIGRENSFSKDYYIIKKALIDDLISWRHNDNPDFS